MARVVSKGKGAGSRRASLSIPEVGEGPGNLGARDKGNLKFHVSFRHVPTTSRTSQSPFPVSRPASLLHEWDLPRQAGRPLEVGAGQGVLAPTLGDSAVWSRVLERNFAIAESSDLQTENPKPRRVTRPDTKGREEGEISRGNAGRLPLRRRTGVFGLADATTRALPQGASVCGRGCCGGEADWEFP